MFRYFLLLFVSRMGQVVKVLASLNVLCSYGLFFFVPSEIVWHKIKPKLDNRSHKIVYYYTMKLFMIVGTGKPDCVVKCDKIRKL